MREAGDFSDSAQDPFASESRLKTFPMNPPLPPAPLNPAVMTVRRTGIKTGIKIAGVAVNKVAMVVEAVTTVRNADGKVANVAPKPDPRRVKRVRKVAGRWHVPRNPAGNSKAAHNALRVLRIVPARIVRGIVGHQNRAMPKPAHRARNVPHAKIAHHAKIAARNVLPVLPGLKTVAPQIR